MSHSKNYDSCHQERTLLKSHRVDLIVTSVPVVSTLMWILVRPYNLAGWMNSGNIFFLAEMIAVLIILSCVGGCVWLVFHLLAHLICHRFKVCLGCCIFTGIIMCTFVIFRLTAKSKCFRFEEGFRQWVLKRADLEAIHNWRSKLEINKSGFPRGIPKNDWPDFIGVLSPEFVNYESSDLGCVELILRWRGGIKRVYGLTVRPKKEKKPYSPNWGGPILEVSQGVYVWWF